MLRTKVSAAAVDVEEKFISKIIMSSGKVKAAKMQILQKWLTSFKIWAYLCLFSTVVTATWLIY